MLQPGARVLDLGCGPGVLARLTKTLIACHFDGIDSDKSALERASSDYEHLVVGDLERHPLAGLAPTPPYDVVILADLLEHLVHPGRLLRQVPGILAPGGRVLISLPHIGYVGLIAELLAGRFAYRSCGLLDHTHLRHFTRASALEFLTLNGFAVTTITTIEKAVADTEFAGPAWARLDGPARDFLGRAVDGEVFQFLIEAVPGGPGVDSAGHPAALT